MFLTGKTFGELTEDCVDWATPKLVTMAKAVMDEGEAVWQSKHAILNIARLAHRRSV